MKVQKSPLNLREHFILKSTFQFHPPTSSDFDANDVFENYEPEFDFKIRNKKGSEFHVITKVEINNVETPEPGYAIQLECLSVFTLDMEATISDQEERNYKFISALSMCINFMRAQVVSMTNSAPLGRYLLPSFDLNALLQEKIRLMEKSNK